MTKCLNWHPHKLVLIPFKNGWNQKRQLCYLIKNQKSYLKYLCGDPLYCWNSLRTKPAKNTNMKYSSVVGSTDEAETQTRQCNIMKTS